MTQRFDEPRDQAVRMGVRTCRWCRERYTWPIGSRSAGCTRCQPTLDQAVAEQSSQQVAT